MTFIADLKYAETQREKLKDFYACKSYENRYVFINKESGVIGKELQNRSIDTIMQVSDKKEIYIEEKIVRWKGKKYTAFTLETDSCTVKGREKDGWMKYGEFDYLLYGLELENSDIEAYIISFQKLKKWFWENYENYRITTTEQINKTACRIVPIVDIKNNVGYKKFFIKNIQPVCNSSLNYKGAVAGVGQRAKSSDLTKQKSLQPKLKRNDLGQRNDLSNVTTSLKKLKDNETGYGGSIDGKMFY